MKTLALLIVVGILDVAVANAGVCVSSEGDFVASYLFREASNQEVFDALQELDDSERDEIRDRAKRVADAGCNADTMLASSLSIYAHLDGTAVEITAPSRRIDSLLKSRKLLLMFVKGYAVDVRDGAPVIVRIFPLRIGGDKLARIIAIMRPGSEEPEFVTCDEPACTAPTPAAKPARK